MIVADPASPLGHDLADVQGEHFPQPCIAREVAHEPEDVIIGTAHLVVEHRVRFPSDVGSSITRGIQCFGVGD
jgi:hypothetical protein